MLLLIAPINTYVVARYVNTTSRGVAFSIFYGSLLISALSGLHSKRSSYVAPLRVMHLGHFLGILLASGASVSIANPNFWWLSVAPFVAFLNGLTVLAILEGFVVAAFAAIAYHYPQLQAPTPEEFFRVHVVAGLATSYAILYLALAVIWRKKLQVSVDTVQHSTVMAIQEKSLFLASMSPEIKNPLFGVLGTIDLMRAPNLSDAQREQLLSIQEQSAKSLLTMLNDIMDWTRIGAGKVELKTATFDLRAVVAETTQLFALQAFNKNLELTYSADPDVPREISGDSLRLRQILNNLTSNAVKFTHHGGIHVHLSLHQEDVGQASNPRSRPLWLQIDISDTGVGIPVSCLSTLFNPDFQAETTNAHRTGGTRLGLSIASELVHLLGGNIRVQSAVGHGSTFSLQLPIGSPIEQAIRESRANSDAMLVCDNPGLIRHMLTLFHDAQVNAQIVAEIPQVTEKTPKLVFIDAALLKNQADAVTWLAAMKSANITVGLLAPPTAQGPAPDSPAGVLYKPVSDRSLENFLIYDDAMQHAAYSARQQELVISGARVLIVENNTINQIIIQKMLEMLGAQGTVAATGYEALEHLKNKSFDVVLLDIELPEIDGIQATRRWRDEAARVGVRDGRRVPIIAITTQFEADMAAGCAAAGMDYYIAKPFSISQLKAALANALRRDTHAQ